MDQQRCAEIFERVRRAAEATDVEVAVKGGRSALTRFANNGITQNVSEEGCTVSVRVQIGGRTARATTNRFDEESLRRVVRQAEALARVQEEDKELLPMLTAAEQGSAPVLDRRCAETAAMGAGERAEHVEGMVAIARRDGLNAAGVYASGESFEALFNSHGVVRWHTETLAEASITMQAGDSSGWQKQNYTSAARLDARALAEIAAEKALRSARPVELPPGKYTVILEPSAVVDLIGFLAADFSGLALLEQRSCLNGRLGTKLFGENISIVDDVRDAGQTGPGFDGEGVGRQGLTLVEYGVVRGVALARGTAARMHGSEIEEKVAGTGATGNASLPAAGARSGNAALPAAGARSGNAALPAAGGRTGAWPTGHGLSLPNEGGEAATNIVFRVADGDRKTVEEMIAATEYGLLVTRLWYIREVDAYEKILTGMTRDGTFLVEGGRVGKGIRNFRFNQSVVLMLKQVLDLGAPVRACGEEAFDMVAPAMRVGGFQFTEVTRF
jgi:predicted Zn-dependent protease